MKKIMRSISIVLIITFITTLCLFFVSVNKVAAVDVSVRTINSTEAANSVGPVSGGIYYLKNQYSGKYLNVNLGKDANGTNVIQWSFDGSTEQKWKFVKNPSNNSWTIYAMCSSNGNNRVLDALRTGGSSSGGIVEGANVDIWAPNDPNAQHWYMTGPFAGGGYAIYLDNAETNGKALSLTVNDTNNGSGAGTSTTSQGNVFLKEYGATVYSNQLWIFENAN